MQWNTYRRHCRHKCVVSYVIWKLDLPFDIVIIRITLAALKVCRCAFVQVCVNRCVRMSLCMCRCVCVCAGMHGVCVRV